MLLAHLSDPHLTTGALAAGPAAALHAAIGRVHGLATRPDAIVVTGDLVDRGRAEEYEQLREVLAASTLPVFLATGNHDRRGPLLDAFAGTPHLAGGEALHYVVDLPGAALVVLDSLVVGSGAGRLGEEQLAWLERTLAARRGQPVVVALHHPPTAVGMPFLDGMGLLDASELAEVVARHARVVRVLCGHVHRAVTTAFAGTVVTTAGSTHQQSVLDLGAPGEMGYVDEPAAFLLHQLTDATGGACVTHLVPVATAARRWAVPPR